MNWGIVGTGSIAHKFATTLLKMKNEGEKLYAIASREQERGEEFQKEFGIPFSFSSYSSLLFSPLVDAVYIALPNNLHFEVAREALEKNKHVLVEKPITLNPKEAEELYNLSAKKGLFLMEAYWVWFLPLSQKLRKIISEDRIGEIEEINLQYGFIAKGQRRERKFLSSLGGGALLDIGIYNFGILEMVIPSFPSIHYSHVRLNEYGTDEWSKTELVYPSGAKAVSLNAIGEEMDRVCRIRGNKGEIFIPDFQHFVTMNIRDANGEESISVPVSINGFEYEIREVTECVRKGLTSSPSYTIEHSLNISRLIYDIRRKWNMKFEGERDFL